MKAIGTHWRRLFHGLAKRLGAGQGAEPLDDLQRYERNQLRAAERFIPR